MQTNAKAVFVEINSACDQDKPGLNLLPANVTADASKRIHTLWATSHFYCTETDITARVLQLPNGCYQVRNVPVYFEQDSIEENRHQDIAIEFDATGKVSDLYIAIKGCVIYVANDDEVSDMAHRQMIVNFLENFRTAYNRKDLKFLKAVYSEDLLIIAGKVLIQQKQGDTNVLEGTQKIQYHIQNKKQYIDKLERIFKNNVYLNVKFDKIAVVRHEEHPNVYGVTLKQEWYASGGYQDVGWMFLMIDFDDEINPLIWVRTWQPLKNPITGEDIDYSTEEIFTLGDFPFAPFADE
jgi:hypothetical protein